MKQPSILPALTAFLAVATLPASVAVAQTAPVNAVSNIVGQYAFYLTGQEQLSGGGTEIVGIGGSVTTDGKGNVTAGILDKNSGSGYSETQTVSGTYQLDSTGKGAFNIVTPAGTIGFTFYASLPLAAGSTRGTVATGAGTILQASGEFGPAYGSFQAFRGNEYVAFKSSGEIGAGTGSYVKSSTFDFVQAPSSPAGTLGGSVTVSGNVVANGVAYTFSGLTGTYTGPFQETNGLVAPGPGRFTMAIPIVPGSSTMAHYAVYHGNFPTGSYFFLSTDPHPASPLEASTGGRTQNYERGSLQ